MLERRVRKPIWTVLGSNLTKSHKKAIALSSMPRTTKLHLSSGVIQYHGLFSFKMSVAWVKQTGNRPGIC